MPSYAYNYSPLDNGHISSNKKALRLWRAGFVVLLIIDAIALAIYVARAGKRLPNPLDDFQQLNKIQVINEQSNSSQKHNVISAVNSTTALSALPQPTTLDPNDHAVVSSLYTDDYIIAITTLGHSLRAVNVSARLILVYIPNRLSSRTLCLATAAGWTLHPVPRIPPPHTGKELSRHYSDQYTKLNIWKLDQLGIKSVVYLDADTLVRKNFDELFTLPFNFGAVPDVWMNHMGFVTGFNAGVLFLRPDTAIFEDMIAKMETAVYPLVWAEQAFLNVYFASQVNRLPYAYNGNLAIKGRSPKLWETLVDDLRIVHYTLEKPFPVDGTGSDEPGWFEKFLEGRLTMDDGLWKDEMTWWQKSWADMSVAMEKPASECS